MKPNNEPWWCIEGYGHSSPVALATAFFLHLIWVFVNMAVLGKVPGCKSQRLREWNVKVASTVLLHAPRESILSSDVAAGDCLMVTVVLLVRASHYEMI